MPCFYTHVVLGPELIRDIEGQEFGSVEEAFASARRNALWIISNEIAAGRYPVVLEFWIEDEAGVHLASLPVSAMIDGLDQRAEGCKPDA